GVAVASFLYLGVTFGNIVCLAVCVSATYLAGLNSGAFAGSPNGQLSIYLQDHFGCSPETAIRLAASMRLLIVLITTVALNIVISARLVGHNTALSDLDSLLSLCPMGVFRTDVNGKIVFANAEFDRLISPPAASVSCDIYAIDSIENMLNRNTT